MSEKQWGIVTDDLVELQFFRIFAVGVAHDRKKRIGGPARREQPAVGPDRDTVFAELVHVCTELSCRLEQHNLVPAPRRTRVASSPTGPPPPTTTFGLGQRPAR